MRLLFLLSLLLGLAAAARAQTTAPARSVLGSISGTLADSATGKPLREASVSLTLARDSSYVTFGITDGDGRFVLRSVALGRYVVQVSALGYRTRRVPVAVTAAAPAPFLGTLRLGALSQKLSEVVVTQERAPVSVSGDTIAFNANSFKTQPNAAVESLLKKLPGVEVDRDGSIRAQGQAVNRVLVDGKPFFGDDPKMATKNLPADIIDKVQLYDQQSDQSSFSGIDDGNRQKTLNLVTKRDKRKGYFGTEAAGVGTDSRYQARLGLNRFNNGRQISALAQANNVNQQGFADEGGPAAASFGPAAGGPSGGGAVIRMGGGGRQNALGSNNTQPTSITESGAVGLNYRDAWGKRAEVATSYLASRATVTTDQQLRRENVAGLTGTETGPPLVTDQSLFNRSTTSSHRFNMRLDYVLDSLTSLRFTPYAWWQGNDLARQNSQQSSLGGRVLNQGLNGYTATTTNPNAGGNFLLMRRFGKPGRSFSANLKSTLSDQDATAFNQATNTFFDAGGVPTVQRLNQRIEQATPTRSNVLSLSYVEPLSLRTKLETHYAFNDSRNDGRRLTTDFNEATQQYDLLNPALSNEFTSRFQANRAGLTLQKKRLRYTVGLGLDAQQADLRVRNLSADTTVDRRFTSLLPNALFTYNGSRSRSLRLNYRTRLNAPTAAQLQPVRDNSNPLSIQAGNPNLRPEYVQTLTANFSQFNASTNRSVFAVLSASRVDDRIVSATTFNTRGVQITRPVNADGFYSVNGFFSLGQRLSKRKINLSLSTNSSFVKSPSLVNGVLNTSRTWSLGQGASANSAFNEQLEFGFSANITYQNARYSLLPNQNTDYLTQTLTADIFYQLPARFVLTSDVWLNNNTGRAAGYNQRLVLWNLGLARQFFANKQGELKLQAYDVLNQNRSVVRNTTETYVEDVRSRILQRYFLLSFTYNLRQFGK
ncbi:outer membrane beta-barrel family protein [Hymenobacter properus]|uniref:Outer membrane beta-barrel protein n=1 Tax=Hymenobacter properus TaxID=2791026 RepID=A0A931BBF1_9BACT|nr:outer membrane beta-barrel family protein [Hymenobacter properus]MBF9140664.1 outer membrane beta-barrel protein [Hymenobacter properus]MBR7719472.1 outer membrane beta-barrel protein [Microvirga sp. SRT04]